jgi:PAS domain S-box-containing protein
LKGKNLLDVTSPEDRNTIATWFLNHGETKDRTADWEKRFLHKDGRVLWGRTTVSRIRGKKGQPDFFVAAILDISERKWAEEALKASERRLQALVGSIDEIVFEFDAEGTYLNVWTTNEELLFQPREALIGRRTRDLLPPDLAATGQSAIQNALATGQAQTFEYPLALAGGRRWFLARISPIPSPAGPPRTVSFLARDITERKEMEENLRESQRRFHDMLENVHLAAVIRDMRGKVIYCNEFLLRLTGYRRDEVVDREWFDLFIPAETREAVRKNWRTMVTSGKTALHFENEILTRQGDRRLMAWNDTLLFDSEGKVIAGAAIGNDITERRKAEKMLRESERMKSEFISTAAHELSTPLTTILGYAEILRNPDDFGITDPNEMEEFLNEILAKGEILADMVTDLLDLSRIEAGRPIPLKKVPCDLADLVKRTLRSYRRQYPGKRFEIGSWDLDQLLTIDPNKIEQVLANLLSNAAKYSGQNGAILLSGERVGNFFQVSVQDDGIGITPEQKARVFEKFYRADASDTAVGGLGLGLCIAKNIIEDHGGGIWMDSTPGQGTTVTFSLPTEGGAPWADRALQELSPEMGMGSEEPSKREENLFRMKSEG